MSGKVRIGVIGTGSFARYHLKLLSTIDRAEVVALCDIAPEQIDSTKRLFPQYEALPVSSNYQDLLLDPGVEAVLICTPHTLHASMVLDSFSAGKHVLVEKPLTTSTEDAREAIAARDRSGLIGAISYQRHGTGQFQYLKETIASGRYGKVLALNSHLAQQWLQFTRGTWRQELALSGGGQINDSGSHMIDILLWATGLRAERVSAMMDNRGTEVDIDSVVSIQFENGAYGSLTVIGDACLWHERHHVWLEKAAIILDGDDLIVIDEVGRNMKVSNWPSSVSPDSNFVSAILDGSPVLAPFECGLRTIELTEAAWKSSLQGGNPVDVSSL